MVSGTAFTRNRGTEGEGGPPAPFHRALSPAHHQEQPSGGPPAAQEGCPVGGQQGPAG